MKARVVLLWTCISVLPAAVIQVACGGEEDGGSSTTDSGAQASNDAASDGNVVKPKPDAGGDDDDDDENCDKSADFTTKIPDASIADGASSTGACIACANANCAKFVKACNESCVCQGVAPGALTCLLQKGNLLACTKELGDAVGDDKAQAAAVGIYTCVNSKCNDECAIDAFVPSDGGTDADAH